MHCCLLKQLRAASMCRSFCLGFAQLCFPGLLLLLSLATLTHGQGGGSPELVPPLPGETPGATAAGSPPPGAAGPPLELPSDATALPEQGGQPPAPAALPPTPSGGIQLSPAPPSGFGLAPGIGAPAGKLAWLQVPLRLPPHSIAPVPNCPRAIPALPAGEQRLTYQGVATVAYAQQPISPYQAVALGCGLGFVSPTFQANQAVLAAQLFAHSRQPGTAS